MIRKIANPAVHTGTLCKKPLRPRPTAHVLAAWAVFGTFCTASLGATFLAYIEGV
jgi:hypothetical protein